jgi:hypothetical protein
MKKRHYGSGHGGENGYRAKHSEKKEEGDLSRRTMEMQEDEMIRSDRSQIANLPQGVIMRPYRDAYDYMPEGINDGISGVDDQISEDNRGRDQSFRPKKV